MRVVDRSASSGGAKGQGEAARLGWGSKPKHPAFQSPKVPGSEKKSREAKEEALGAVGGPQWVRSKVRGIRALPFFPKLRRLQLAPGRGPSTLEFGQAVVPIPLLPSHPHFLCGCRQLPAVAPTPALKARGLSNRGKNDLMRVGAGGGRGQVPVITAPLWGLRASGPFPGFLQPAPLSGSAGGGGRASEQW